MDLLKQLIIIDKSSDVPVYLQIANAMISEHPPGKDETGSKASRITPVSSNVENPSKDNAGCPRGTLGAGMD